MIVSKFHAELLENAISQTFPQLYVGRIMLSNDQLIAPVSGKPCVYYETIAEELVERKDANGNSHTVWEFRFKETKAADFYIADPRTTKRAFVKGTANNIIKVSNFDAQNNSGFNASLWQSGSLSPSFQVSALLIPNQLFLIFLIYKIFVINQILKGLLSRNNFHSGNRVMRYLESSYEIGEQIAVLGMLKMSEELGQSSYYFEPVQHTVNAHYFTLHTMLQYLN